MSRISKICTLIRTQTASIGHCVGSGLLFQTISIYFLSPYDKNLVL